MASLIVSVASWFESVCARSNTDRRRMTTFSEKLIASTTITMPSRMMVFMPIASQ